MSRPSTPIHGRPRSRSGTRSPSNVADRAVCKIADHRDAVQKKTFTKWVNNHLQKVNVRILDLYEELRDGNNLLLLLELLCKTNLPRERGQLRFHRLQNVQTALEFLQSQQVKLVNIRSEDIVDGNPKLTLGLIWTIILHYQISEVEVVGKQEQMTAKEALLLWAQKVTQGYPSVEVGNFTSSWKDGLAFNAIIHRYRPDLVDFSKLNKATPDQNLEYSFHVAEKELGVPRLLDVEDLVHTDHPDEKSVMTYVSSLYEIFPKEPTVQEVLHDNEKLFKFEEYCNLAKVLVVEINRVIQRLEKQRFPKTVQGIKELIVDYNRYRISEFPDMEASRHSLKMVFRELQALYGPMATWLEFPYECSPRELEVSWTRLVETQDNYNKSLRIELTRLEQMYHVAEKIQKEATLVDASLDDIEERIKSEEEVGDTIDNETRRKHFYQIEKSLVMFESSIKHMISGVDILIAGRYSRADELRIKVQSIERRWSEMKDRLETRSTKVLTYQTFSTSDGKKMKLELPVEKTVVSTEETTPTSDYPDEEGVKTRRKVITITKRTYRSSGGTPTETRTTVARIMSAEGLDDDSSDSGISPQGRTRVKMKFGTEEGTGNKSQRLDAMLVWIRETKDVIDNEDFGLDLPSAQKYQQNHHVQHDAVLAFQDELDKIKKLEAEDRSLHEKIIEIHEEYAALVKSSVDRINHLKSLVAFMSEATKELIWMNQREEPEVSRDWSCTDLDIEDLQAHGENLEFDIREREPQYNMLLAKGDNLIQTGHPAPGPIEAYLNAMRSQWWWLNQLIIAFQQHVRNAEMYQQYFQDAHTTEQKMIQLVERLNTEYDVQNISSRDAAEQALNSLTEMKQELVDFKDVISSLQLLSKKVVPLPQRKSKLKNKVLVDPVCSYKNMQNIVNKGEECLLLDNSEHHSWKITNASSRQCEVPSVCFVIPAPDVEATEFSTRLEIQYKHLLTLWRTRHWNLKQALSKEQVFTNVKVIKSTSPEKGKLPLLAGSKDVDQLLKDIQMPDDQEIVGITERLVEQEPVTAATVSLSEQPVETITNGIQSVQTLDKQSAQSTLNDLLAWLNRAEAFLKTKSRETLNQGSLSSILLQVENLKEQQTQRTPQYDSLMQALITKMDPQLQSKLGLLSEKWIRVKEETYSWHRMLVFLLNIAELVSDLEDSLRRVEIILIQQPGLTANLKDIQHQIKVLQGALQTEIEPRKSKIEDIRRSLPDLKDFDKTRVQAILERWEAAQHQIDNRLVGLVKAEHKLEQFQAGLQNELVWLERVEEKVQDRDSGSESRNAESVMEELTALYTDIRSQQVPIKTLCTMGHEYTDESQVWERNLEEYRHSLHHLPESRDPANPLLESAQKGREEIIASLMSMNARYEKLLNDVQIVMEVLVDTLKRQGKEHKEVEEACLQWCSSIQHLLDWLSDTEKTLVAQTASPADVKELEEQIEEQKVKPR